MTAPTAPSDDPSARDDPLLRRIKQLEDLVRDHIADRRAIGQPHPSLPPFEDTLGTHRQVAIASGAIRADSAFLCLDTESAAASDDLDTIHGGVLGMRLVLVGVNASRVVTIKNETGNLYLEGDYALDSTTKAIMLINDGIGNWLEIGRQEAVSGMLKTQSGGYFLIPTGPGAGTSISSSTSADTYGSWTEMSASAPADIFIVGIAADPDANIGDHLTVDIGTGAAASETSVGEAVFLGNLGTSTGPYTHRFPFPIPVASGTRIACRVADEDAAARTSGIVLTCINQADLVSV